MGGLPRNQQQKGDAVSYFLKYRTPEGRQRWHTIGRHGAPWTPDMARDTATALLGEIVKGSDPAGERAARPWPAEERAEHGTP